MGRDAGEAEAIPLRFWPELGDFSALELIDEVGGYLPPS